jgi:hypothetical protein
MGRHTSSPVRAVLQALKDHGSGGVHFHALAAQFADTVDRTQLGKTLSNLRARGLAHNRLLSTGNARQWFFGPDAHNTDIIHPSDAKRIERARLQDQYQPMRFYGEGMVAPRAPSVWAYARSFAGVAPT